MGHLAVAQGKDVNKGGHERRSACFSFAPEFTQDKHPIPSVNKLLGDNRELLIIRGNGAYDLFGYCLHPSMDSRIIITRCLRLVPLNVRVQSLQDGRDVASGEGLVYSLCESYIFL